MEYTEQRRFQRYLPPQGAIATLKPDADFGPIKDISRGGMAFECLSFIKACDPEIGCPKEIEIFIPGKHTPPVTVPCKVVRIEKKLLGSYAHSVVPRKRCGVQFTQFGLETAFELEIFIGRCWIKGAC